MNNKVIEVLDYMGEKFGIAIDWTAENVMPQVTEFLKRYQTYSIAKHAIWIIIGLIIVVICTSWMKKTYTNIINGNEKSFWFKVWNEIDGEAAVIAFYIIAVVLTIVFSCIIVDKIFTVVEWITIPEMKFFETFSELLKETK